MLLLEIVSAGEVKYLLQNYRRIIDLLPALQGELKAFYESDVNEDELLESAMIGNRAIYRSSNDGGTFSPDPGGKATSIIQNKAKVITGVKAEVCREIITDISLVGFFLEKLSNTLQCLRGDELTIIKDLMDGQSSTLISDRLRMTKVTYNKRESNALQKVGTVSHIIRKDYERIKELLETD